MPKKNSKRPTGWLGKLYDSVSEYSANPNEEIERLLEEARKGGKIDDNRYTVAKHRLPLPGHERKTLAELANMLGFKSKDRPRQLEFSIYRILCQYLK